MDIQKVKPRFIPISITFETEEEAMEFMSFLYFRTPTNSKILSELYRHLKTEFFSHITPDSYNPKFQMRN